MFQQSSFTNQADDYLTTFIQNRVNNHKYNHDNSPSQNDEEIQSDFAPFMKRHSSSGDSYIGEHGFTSEMESGRHDEYQEENQSSIERQNMFTKRYKPHDNLDQDTKENTKFDDSFLELVDQHLSNVNKDKENLNTFNQQENPSKLNPNRQAISLSKTQISHALLQNQSITDSIQFTNLLPTQSIAKIINSPFEFRLLNAKNKFIKKDQVEISLEPYETVQIEFQIKRRQAEIGNIYETLKIETYEAVTNDKRIQLQKKYLKFEITFVKPKLQVTFLGKTTVKRIQEHKIAHFDIYPNELNQYFINLIFSQQQFSTLNSSKLERIECQIEAKGYISVHPNSVILYQDEPLKIVLRKVSQLSGAGKTSVIVIKPLHSSLVYVVGVKCMDKKVQKNDEENNIKMSKFQF